MANRRQFSKEFKVEAVGWSKAEVFQFVKAAKDLNVHENVLRKWVHALSADSSHAFPGHGQMKPEQLAIAKLCKEVAKLKMERDILKKPRWVQPLPTSPGNRCEIQIRGEAQRNLAAGTDLRRIRCLAWFLCLADANTAQTSHG